MSRGNANRRGGYRGGNVRGSQTSARGGGGGGGGRGRGGYPNPSAALLEEGLDFSTQMYANATTNDRPSTPGRGRGRAHFTPKGKATPRGGYNTPGGSGLNTPNRGRGRAFVPPGRGRHHEGIGSSPQTRGGLSRPNATLSNLLYQERSLLKPIIFVPSIHSKVLFQDNDDELLKAVVEDVDDTERSHVPTAERVSRVFSGSVPHFSAEDDEGAAEDLEEIEEVDFNDIGKLFDPNAPTSIARISKTQTTVIEEQFTGAFLRTSSSTLPMDKAVEELAKQVEERLSTAGDDAPEVFVVEPTPNITSFAETITTEQLFFVDTEPTTVQPDLQSGFNVQLPTALQDDEDDIIVYVAPHPRHSSTAASADERDTIRPMSTTEDNATPQTSAPDTSLFTPYVPPLPITISLPNATPATTSKPPTASVSFSFAASEASLNGIGSSTPARLLAPPVTTPRMGKLWKQKLSRASAKKNKTKAKGKGKKGRGTFGSFGAMREEALLVAALDAGNDPRFHERRKGDSDLEWGDSDNEVQQDDMERVLEMLQSQTSKGKAKAAEDDHGMEIDSDLDLSAMQNFIGGMLGHDAGHHMTLDDFEDEKLMRMEDEEQAGDRGSSGDEGKGDDSADDREADEVLNKEEALLISEAIEVDGPIEFEDSEADDDDDDDDDDELDEDNTPRSNFQARLERMRENALRRKTDGDADGEDGDENDEGEEDDWFARYLTKAEQDDVYLDDIEDLLDENQAMLFGTGSRKIKQLFGSISNGDFDNFEGFSSPARRRKDKGKGLPPDLHAQWKKDRARKAEFKKQRDLAKLVAAADPLVRKKGGKKARLAIQRAASLDPTIHVLPNRVIDISSLVQQIRRFIADVGGPSTMSLPPTNKHTRKNIHEMALAFKLKSVSKGTGDARYTTLTKTTRSSFGADERKIAKIVRRSGGPGALGNEFIYEGKGRGGPMPKHKEGDEVGGAAPKLTESNVGFRLLAMMGWAEGDRIGSSMKGLEAPLTAIIKTSKRGLGATK